MTERPPNNSGAAEPPACPLVCGAASVGHWLVARFPHAVRAAVLVAAALLCAAIYNAANPLSIRWLPASGGRIGIPRAYESRLPQIDEAEAFSLLQSGDFIFLDSRDEQDYEKDHIPGAINVPQRKWIEVWPKMKSQLPRDAAYVLCCYGGHCGLSTRQAKRLLALGYENLRVMDHGWEGWTEAGYPTDQRPQGKAD